MWIHEPHHHRSMALSRELSGGGKFQLKLRMQDCFKMMHVCGVHLSLSGRVSQFNILYICIYIFLFNSSLAIDYVPSTICSWDFNHQLNCKANKNTLLWAENPWKNVNLQGVDLCWNQMYLLFLFGIFCTPWMILECRSNEFYGVFQHEWTTKKNSPTYHKWCCFDGKFLSFTGCETMEFSQWSGPEASRRPEKPREKRLGPLKPADLSETLWF